MFQIEATDLYIKSAEWTGAKVQSLLTGDVVGAEFLAIPEVGRTFRSQTDQNYRVIRQSSFHAHLFYLALHHYEQKSAEAGFPE